MVSHDNTTEMLGKGLGMGYNDAYDHFDFFKDILPIFIESINKATKKGRNIIVDCTNMKKSDRTETLSMIPSDYKKNSNCF